jgi:chloramphenicol 3-O-phosphotransferase
VVDYPPGGDMIGNMLIPRNLKTLLLEASSHMRVVLVNGARQTGKSTLMQGLFDFASVCFCSRAVARLVN